ncbi:MAG: helix-turn-helix domain-containing protein [Dehalococcoidia bacterium]|nr:helix-turn-helix domain-containing protein [Dehalococcoidia bacterium]
MSWLYDRRDQLDGYRLFAEIAHPFRLHVLPEDRDDIEQDIIVRLIEVSNRQGEVSSAYLTACARYLVIGYWRKKYRERRRCCRLYEGDKGEMVADGWKFVTPLPDIEAELDAKARLQTLPKRMIKAGVKRAEGEKLNNADKLYLCRNRHRLSKFNWSDAEKIERMRQLYVDEGLPCAAVAKIVGKGRATVQRHLNKLGVIRH